MAKKRAEPFINCTIKQLPESKWAEATEIACRENPMNMPRLDQLASLIGVALIDGADFEPLRLAFTSAWWKAGGVDLTVGFMDSTTPAFRDRLFSHFNAPKDQGFANITARWTQTSPQVRIAFAPNEGYYSYLGTQILSISNNKPTMNLARFNEKTPESEFLRVARHEWLHTCGSPHEHARRPIIALLNEAGVILWGQEELEWSEQQVRQQILTPLEERSIMGTTEADVDSIMCYGFPGKTRSGVKVTKSGLPIIGGKDFSPADKAFLAKTYPLPDQPPPPPPPPPSGTNRMVLTLDGKTSTYALTTV